jgi:hypothetical protein
MSENLETTFDDLRGAWKDWHDVAGYTESKITRFTQQGSVRLAEAKLKTLGQTPSILVDFSNNVDEYYFPVEIKNDVIEVNRGIDQIRDYVTLINSEYQLIQKNGNAFINTNKYLDFQVDNAWSPDYEAVSPLAGPSEAQAWLGSLEKGISENETKFVFYILFHLLTN